MEELEINKLKSRVEFALNYVNLLKQDSLNFIQNKEFPLKERWEYFRESPEYIFNHRDYSLHFPIFESQGYEICYEGEIHAERYQTIDVASRFESFFDDLEAEGKLELIDQIKEEILESGVRTFYYDW